MDFPLDPAGHDGPVPASRRPLWIAIAALGTVVVALGATLAYTQLRAPAADANTQNARGEAPGAPGDPVSVQKQPVAPVKAGAGATTSVAKSPPPLPGSKSADRAPLCAQCGEVESVTPVQRAGQGSGVGVVAGGVLGAIVGNQIGKGNGRTAATVLGAVGGGYAGNQVEKSMNQQTVYQVRVRMQDGSVRTIEQATAPAVGARVNFDGSALR